MSMQHQSKSYFNESIADARMSRLVLKRRRSPLRSLIRLPTADFHRRYHRITMKQPLTSMRRARSFATVKLKSSASRRYIHRPSEPPAAGSRSREPRPGIAEAMRIMPADYGIICDFTTPSARSVTGLSLPTITGFRPADAYTASIAISDISKAYRTMIGILLHQRRRINFGECRL